MSGALLVLEGKDRRVVSDGRYGSRRLLISTRTTTCWVLKARDRKWVPVNS